VERVAKALRLFLTFLLLLTFPFQITNFILIHLENEGCNNENDY